MVVSREDGKIEHQHFYDLPKLLRPGDLLIVNDSKVLPARLYGEKEKTGAAVELLLLEHKEQDIWEVLVRPGKKLKEGTNVVFGGGKLRAEIVQHLENGNRLVRFFYEGNFYALLDEIGQMPLPHYITAQLKDKDRYQTVYGARTWFRGCPYCRTPFYKRAIEHIAAEGSRGCLCHSSCGTWDLSSSERRKYFKT